jgi:hypothetical protein
MMVIVNKNFTFGGTLSDDFLLKAGLDCFLKPNRWILLWLTGRISDNDSFEELRNHLAEGATDVFIDEFDRFQSCDT